MDLNAQSLEQTLAQLSPELQSVVQQYVQQSVDTALTQAAQAQAAAQAAAVPQPQVDLVRQRESILKMAKQAPRYHGKPSEDAIVFVRSLDLKWFPAYSITDNAARADALGYLLASQAETWYLGLKERGLLPEFYQTVGQELGLKDTFLQQFNPPDVTGKYRREFDSLEQTSSAAVYTAKFCELCLRLGYNLEDQEIRHRFVDKLKHEVKLVIRMALLTNPPTDFNQLSILVKQVDEDQYLLAQQRRTPRHFSNPQAPPPSTPPAQRTAPLPTTNTPMDVGSITPPDTRSRMTPELRVQLITERKCFYCRQSGHIAVNCPNKTTKSDAAPNGHGQ